MRGWVYVITNRAIPDKVKIGYTERHPLTRAIELDSTGLPFAYAVEFAALVNEPYEVEQEVHSQLGNLRAGKEWFNCLVPHAAESVRQVASKNLIFHCHGHGFDSAPEGYRRGDYGNGMTTAPELFLPTAALAAIVGPNAKSKGEVTKLMWEYITRHQLQDPVKRTDINADELLRAVVADPKVSMFELIKRVNSCCIPYAK